MCFNDEDARLWEEDPSEYIRKGYDIIEDVYSEKNAAATFIQEMAEKRAAQTVPLLMQYVVTVFNEFQQAIARGGGGGGGAAVDTTIARKMDGALMAVGSLQVSESEREMDEGVEGW